MIRCVSVLMLVLLMMSTSCKKPKNGIVSGTVIAQGQVLEGAVVSIARNDANSYSESITDANGYYALNRESGLHDVVAKFGRTDGSWETQKKSVEILESTRTTVDFHLPKPLMLNATLAQVGFAGAKVNLAWNASDAEGFESYQIYRTLKGEDEVLIHSSTEGLDTSFIDLAENKGDYTYHVVLATSEGEVARSNDSMLSFSGGNEGSKVVLSELYYGYLDQGETKWLELDVVAGNLYSIAWYDNWWPEYSAGSIWVTGFHQDKSTVYFQRDRLIQLIGSPKVIMANETETIYLKIEGYNGTIEGTYGVLVEQLAKSSSTELSLDSSLTGATISAGQVKLFHADMMSMKDYSISFDADQYSGAYGDNVQVKFSGYGDESHSTYFFEESAGVSSMGFSNKVTVSPQLNERLYFAVVGAYWWDPRAITLAIKEE